MEHTSSAFSLEQSRACRSFPKFSSSHTLLGVEPPKASFVSRSARPWARGGLSFAKAGGPSLEFCSANGAYELPLMLQGWSPCLSSVRCWWTSWTRTSLDSRPQHAKTRPRESLSGSPRPRGKGPTCHRHQSLRHCHVICTALQSLC